MAILCTMNTKYHSQYFQLITHGFNPMSNRSFGSPKYVVLRSLCRWVNGTYKTIHKSNLYLVFVIVLGGANTDNKHTPMSTVYLIIIPTHISHTIVAHTHRLEIIPILIIYRHYEGFLCYINGGCFVCQQMLYLCK